MSKIPFACPAGWEPPPADDVVALLHDSGLSQSDAARALGVSRSAVSTWCTGQRSVSWPVWRTLLGVVAEVAR